MHYNYTFNPLQASSVREHSAAVTRTFANAAIGWLAESMGWTGFFLLCALLAIPGMMLKVTQWGERSLRNSVADEGNKYQNR